jgi:hypothetical protein
MSGLVSWIVCGILTRALPRTTQQHTWVLLLGRKPSVISHTWSGRLVMLDNLGEGSKRAACDTTTLDSIFGRLNGRIEVICYS